MSMAARHVCLGGDRKRAAVDQNDANDPKPASACLFDHAAGANVDGMGVGLVCPFFADTVGTSASMRIALLIGRYQPGKPNWEAVISHTEP
jgi:hypothetical protein